MAGVNPFQPLYDVCNTGDPATKWAALPDFPRLIDVEPVGLCNMRCLMCPTGIQALGREQGTMDWNTWQGIVDACAPHGTALRLIGWGEPLLHPGLVNMIEYASRRTLLTHINTNGTKLTRDLAKDLMDAGLSSIKLSFQGTDRKSYAEMRQADFFEALIDTLAMLWQMRGKKPAPFIAVSTSTTHETEDQVVDFVERVFPISDQITVGKTTFDFFDHSAALPRQKALLAQVSSLQAGEKRHPDPCPEVYDKLSIHWDGSVAICCNAYSKGGEFGNVNTTPLAELWHHPAMEAYRERLARKEYTGPLCGVCYDYADLTRGNDEAALEQ